MKSCICWHVRFLILACLAIIGSSLALAQTGTTSIRGTVGIRNYIALGLVRELYNEAKDGGCDCGTQCRSS